MGKFFKDKIKLEKLILLRNWLEANKNDINLNMGSYRQGKDGNSVAFVSHHNCGTVGCVLGWSPFVKGLEPIEDDYVRSFGKHVDFLAYSDRVFNIEAGSNIWNFLFSANWKSINNTTEGAINRLTYVIDNFDSIEYFEDHTPFSTFLCFPQGTSLTDWEDTTRLKVTPVVMDSIGAIITALENQ